MSTLGSRTRKVFLGLLGSCLAFCVLAQSGNAHAASFRGGSDADALELLSFGVMPASSRQLNCTTNCAVAPAYVGAINDKINATIAMLKIPITSEQSMAARVTLADAATQVISAELPGALALYGQAVRSKDPVTVKTGLMLGKSLMMYGSVKSNFNTFRTQYGSRLQADSHLQATYSALNAQLNTFKSYLDSVTDLASSESAEQSLFESSRASGSKMKSLLTELNLANGRSNNGPGYLAWALVALNVAILVEIAAIAIPVVVFGLVDTDGGTSSWENLSAMGHGLELQAAQVVELQ